jgi:hypothetical protein
MALDPNLNFNFDSTQQAALIGLLNDFIDALNQPGVPYVNLTKEERKEALALGETRLPYVQNAVENILPNTPGLVSDSIPLVRTETLLDLALFIRQLKPLLAEIEDRTTDLQINAEDICYLSILDSYETAKRQRGRLPGADVFYELISPLFAGQGPQTPTPPAPGGDN